MTTVVRIDTEKKNREYSDAYPNINPDNGTVIIRSVTTKSAIDAWPLNRIILLYFHP